MFCENTIVTRGYLIAVHSCSRHGVAAARLTLGALRWRYTSFKNIDSVPSTFVASLTAGVFETDRRRLAVRTQLGSPK